MLRKQKPNAAEKNIFVFYDNWCPLCSGSVRFYQRLDWLGRISFLPCRDEILLEKYKIDQEKAIRRMTAVRVKKAKKHPKSMNSDSLIHYEGIDTIILMSAQIPLLWPVVPVLMFLHKIGLGVTVYDWIANNRKIIPIGQCETDACPIPQDRSLQ